MATDNNSYFSNAAPGHAEALLSNVYRLDATPKAVLGYRISRMDGNIYRYAQFGAATNRGLLCSQDISETSVPDTDNGMIAPASAQNTSDGTLNSRFIEITMSSVVLNQFAGGYLITTDDTGEGYSYRIKGNTAAGTPTTGNYRLELYDRLQVAIDATTDYTIIGCMYSDIEAATTATDGAMVGVSCATTTAAKPFAFVQTRGVVGVLQDASTVLPAAGDMVVGSLLTAGAIGRYVGGSVGTTVAADHGRLQIVGFCLDPGDSTGATTIFLQLE